MKRLTTFLRRVGFMEPRVDAKTIRKIQILEPSKVGGIVICHKGKLITFLPGFPLITRRKEKSFIQGNTTGITIIRDLPLITRGKVFTEEAKDGIVQSRIEVTLRGVKLKVSERHA